MEIQSLIEQKLGDRKQCRQIHLNEQYGFIINISWIHNTFEELPAYCNGEGQESTLIRLTTSQPLFFSPLKKHEMVLSILVNSQIIRYKYS